MQSGPRLAWRSFLGTIYNTSKLRPSTCKPPRLKPYPCLDHPPYRIIQGPRGLHLLVLGVSHSIPTGSQGTRDELVGAGRPLPELRSSCGACDELGRSPRSATAVFLGLLHFWLRGCRSAWEGRESCGSKRPHEHKDPTIWF